MTRTRTAAAIGVGLVALAALLWRCRASPERPAETGAPAAAVTRPVDGVVAGQAAAPAAEEPDSAAPAALPSATSTSTTTPASASSASAVIDAVARRDARDLALLSRIERELQRDPPPVVHALIRLREAGASRDALLTRAREIPPGEVALRVLVFRWIDEVRPSGAPRAPSGTPSNSGPPLVQPIERAKP